MTNEAIRRSTLVVAITGSFLTPFMGSSVNIALPAIEKSFNIDAVTLSWIATAYLLAAGASLIPMGRLADIYGRKKILGLGFCLFSISSLLSALAPNACLLIFFRAVQGIGSGMIFGTGMAMLTSVFPPQERGKVLGIAISSVYIGLSSGPFFGGVLTQHWGWRSLFGFNFLLSFIPLLLIYIRLKGEWADAKGENFDLTGAVMYSLTLIAVIYGFSLLPQYMGFVLLATGIAGLVAFTVRQTRIKDPLFDVHLFVGNRVFALSNLAALIHYSATFALNFLLSLYLQYIKGLNAQTAGLILISQPVVMALFSPLAGRMSDKIEPRIIASTGMSITCISILFLAFIQPATLIASIILYLIVLGFGYALFSSPNMNAIMGSVGKPYLGVASGSAATMRVLGQMFSMGIATLIISIFMGSAPITEAIFPKLLLSIRTTLIIFSLLCIIGIFASLSRGNVRSIS
ncbi:MAG: MFS transporter [delta proteobacterium ML8_D]|nr:MAG: MFS transporter [delta proteobacterium ML8_D]